jgi:glycerol-3-phosphate dehydrogenase
MSGLSVERTQIGVLGGGAWGTALGIHCARMGHKVLMWAREPEVCQQHQTGPGMQENLQCVLTSGVAYMTRQHVGLTVEEQLTYLPGILRVHSHCRHI